MPTLRGVDVPLGRCLVRQLRRGVPAAAGREFEILQRMNGGRKISLLLSQHLMEPGIFNAFQPVLIWAALYASEVAGWPFARRRYA